MRVEAAVVGVSELRRNELVRRRGFHELGVGGECPVIHALSLVITLRVFENAFDSEVGRVLFAQVALDFGFVVVVVAKNLLVEFFAQRRNNVQGLLADDFDLGQIEVVFGNYQAQVNQVHQTLANTRLVQTAGRDLLSRPAQLVQEVFDFLH